MKIILASNSKQRQDILNMLNLKYEVITSKVEEQSNEKDPNKYVIELSKNKAYSVKKELKEASIIIAADTIVYFNNKIYEKPKTKEEAYLNMKEMSNQKTEIITGVTILDLYQNKELNFSDKAEIIFNKIIEEDIKWYVENEHNLLQTCGYVILGKASFFLKEVKGDYYTALGLSPSKVYEHLQKLGYTLKDFELK